MNNKTLGKINKGNLDKIGIVCSGACVFHCVSAPIIALASPVFARFFENEIIHIGLLTCLTPVAIYALFSGHLKHKRYSPVAYGSLGIMFLILALFIETMFGYEVQGGETAMTLVGCALLIAGHFYNLKYAALANSRSSFS